MKKYRIFNLNIPVFSVIAKTPEGALDFYCNSRMIYDKRNYRAEKL